MLGDNELEPEFGEDYANYLTKAQGKLLGKYKGEFVLNCPVCTTKFGSRQMTYKDGVYDCGCGYSIKKSKEALRLNQVFQIGHR